MQKRRAKFRGFTLIEMVTVIGIISILVAMGVPAFAAYQRHNSIRIAAQDIKGYILEAQNLSLNPRPEDKGWDYYFARFKKTNAEISLGVGKFKDDGRRDLDPNSEKSIKNPRSLGNDVSIESIQPDRIVNGDENIATYVFIIPTGDIMFDYLEPYPGVGYSELCKTVPEHCAYTEPANAKSIIELWLKDGSTEERYLEHQIVVDGQGGDVKIIENPRQSQSPTP